MSSLVEANQSEWSSDDKKTIPPLYGCEILLDNTSLELAGDSTFPTDSYIVTYCFHDRKMIDVCRGSKTSIFDMYYDKFGPNSIQKIDWSNGRVNPNLWRKKSSTKSKRKR
jgi:hypothetical protein